jgi:hypothetical protein
MLQHVELVQDDGGTRQARRDRVQIRAMHVCADRLNCRALSRIQAGRHQAGQGLSRPVRCQAHHFPVHEVREHGVELLLFAAVDFIGAQVPRPAPWPRVIPREQKRPFRPARFRPAHPMPDGRMARRHRLAIETDHLAQAARDPRLRVGEPDPFRTNPAGPTADAALAIHRTLAKRSHLSSLVVGTSREDTIESSIARGVAFTFLRSASTGRGGEPPITAERSRAELASSFFVDFTERCIQIEVEPLFP